VPLLRLVLVPVVVGGMLTANSWAHESAAGHIERWLGYLLVAAGLLIRCWSWLHLGHRSSRGLVTTGPYSVCRNPLYMGTFAIAFGAGLCLDNVMLAGLVLLIVVLTHVPVVLAEERHLAAKFGESYEAYKRQAPRFVPAISLYTRAVGGTVPVRTVRKTLVDVVLILLIPPACEMITLLRESGVIPILLRWP